MGWLLSIGAALIAIGCLLLWLKEHLLRKRLETQLEFILRENAQIPLLRGSLKEQEAICTQAEVEKRVIEEKLISLKEAQEELKLVFRSLSFEALQKNNQSFLDLAQVTLEKFQEGAKGDLEKRQQAIQALLQPMQETLHQLNQGVQEIEKERKVDQESLKEQIRSLFDTEKQLRQETSNLVKALRTPLTRGRWGEIQLRRVVELSGMLNHCDFFEQQQETNGEGRYRPDMIVRLPGGRQVIIDAKVPLEAYLEAVHAEEESVRLDRLKDHARQVRAHVLALSRKSYWEHFQPSPEFVVLFLPAETFFSAALEHDPSLIEAGAQQKVILATPTTLIALLRAVAYGWQQDNLNRQVEAMQLLGNELYKRLADMSAHFAKMGRALNTAVDAYNKGVGSLEARVLVSARKFNEWGVVSAPIEIEALPVVEKTARD